MNHPDALSKPLLALGFRLFFLLAGLAGALLIAFRQAVFAAAPATYYGPVLWHAHEMIFGYTAAVIAGFLLTAVRNWTALDTARGGRLAALGLCWLYGRLLPFYGSMLPDGLVALADLAFLPWLAVEVARPVVRARMQRHLVFVLLLALMAVGNGLVHAQVLKVSETTAGLGLRLALDAVLVMILVIAGRIFPFFTERALPSAAPRRRPSLDILSVATALLLFFCEGLSAPAPLTAAAAVATVLCSGLRLKGWHHPGVWRLPLLWVLYLGYGWLIIGFLLSAAAAFGTVAPSVALHAYTAGAIGVLTLGMMSRVSLGHSGRPLIAGKAVIAVFALINLAAGVRVIGPLLWPAGYAAWLGFSTGLWLAAFVIFLWVFLPIWVSPRADGKPG